MTELITLLVVIPLFCVVALFWAKIVVAICRRFGFHGYRLRLERRGSAERPSAIREPFRARAFPNEPAPAARPDYLPAHDRSA